MLNVKKRDGRLESYDAEKINKVLSWATEGLTGVSASDVAMNAGLSIYDGVTTDEIHETLIQSADNLFSKDEPNYQHVAARLLNYQLRKRVWGSQHPPRLYDLIKDMTAQKLYTTEILEKYTEQELHKVNVYIKHDRDYDFTHSALRQIADKYLIKNRFTGQLYETPQFAYIMIALVGFMNEDKAVRLGFVKRAYEHFSNWKISIPTPVLAGLRTPIKQFSSCVLIDVDDTLPSIFASVSAVGGYTARRAGIGLNVGRIRPINSKIRGGEVIHTGIIPYLKIFEAACKATSQNGLRGSGSTVNAPWWHYEIEDIIQLKNNAGTDDNRVRKLDYCIGMNRLVYERFVKDEEVTLFSPHEAVGLYDVFGNNEKFEALYRKYESDESLKFKKRVKARKLVELLVKERLETGRIYILNVDHANTNTPWKGVVNMTNLCAEVLVRVEPIQDVNDPDGEIGVCTLAALNLLKMKDDDWEDVCDIVVRLLCNIIEYQDYPFPAAANFALNRKSLGIGITNLAGFLAKHKTFYEDKKALDLVDEFMEKMSHGLLRASCNLAKERGPCPKFQETTYSAGTLPLDRYNKSVDAVCSRKPTLDWEALRADILQHGLATSTLTAQMPVESSSVVQNSTNGAEPVRSLMSIKKSKAGSLKQLVPNYQQYKNYYTLAFDMETNKHVTEITAVMQKYMDMSISANHYYNYKHYDGGNIPLSVLVKDLLYAYKLGVKTLYYANSDDNADTISCAGGSCSV